jgi:hypothetical protein
VANENYRKNEIEGKKERERERTPPIMVADSFDLVVMIKDDDTYRHGK